MFCFDMGIFVGKTSGLETGGFFDLRVVICRVGRKANPEGPGTTHGVCMSGLGNAVYVVSRLL